MRGNKKCGYQGKVNSDYFQSCYESHFLGEHFHNYGNY